MKNSNGWDQGAPPPPEEAWWEQILKEGECDNGEYEQATPSGIRSRSERQGSIEDWSWAANLYEADEAVELPIIGYNRGGLLVEARSLRGFVPVSHLIDPVPDEQQARERQLASLVGDRLRLKVIEFDPERGRLVLSQRAGQAEPGERLRLLERLAPGDCVTGKVTNITRFGVFVELGGLEGLIHVSELSWGRVAHPADVVHCGQQLEVRVLSVDREACRVALSLKDLMPDPWARVEQLYAVGDVVQGVITNVVRFGAFVALSEGLEGLIHVSELGEGNLLHPRNVVSEGERVTARIIHLDAAERRLGLSLRQIGSQAAADRAEAAHP